MSKIRSLLFVWILFFTAFQSSHLFALNSTPSLTVNIFSKTNGKGLENDRRILKKALEDLGCVVIEKDLFKRKSKRPPLVDINIFLERIDIKWLPHAKQNWFIPNPEIFWDHPNQLKTVDLVLCKTHFTEEVFQKYGCKTFYLGFSSLDCYNENTTKDFSRFLHIAGSSPFKGTTTIIETWKRNPFLPLLNLLIHYTSDNPNAPSPIPLENLHWQTTRVSNEELRFLQNHVGIHLCISEAEGFGHTIMEAMSCGAIVITTNAPPMNEFITDLRCLVPFATTKPVALGTRFLIEPSALEKSIENLLLLPMEELQKMSQENREQFQKSKEDFLINLELLINQTKTNIRIE